MARAILAARRRARPRLPGRLPGARGDRAMSEATVAVPLGARAYEIRIGPGLLARAGAEIAPLLRRPRVAVLTERRVASLHLPALRAGLAEAGIASSVLELEPGEATKGWAGARAGGRVADRREGRPRRPRRRLRRRRRRRPRGLRRGGAAPRRRLRADPDDAARPGRQLGRRQDRDQLAPGQEPGRRLPPAAAGARRHRAPRHPARARLPRRLRRGGEVRPARRRGLLRLARGERRRRSRPATRRPGSTRCAAPAR